MFKRIYMTTEEAEQLAVLVEKDRALEFGIEKLVTTRKRNHERLWNIVNELYPTADLTDSDIKRICSPIKGSTGEVSEPWYLEYWVPYAAEDEGKSSDTTAVGKNSGTTDASKSSDNAEE